MKRRGLQQPHVSHPNVTPLIDIVMCLVIFFMLVAKIGVSTGADPSIQIPVAALGDQLKSFSNTLVLNIKPKAGLPDPLVTALVEGSAGQAAELRTKDSSTGKDQLADVLRKLRFGADGKPGGKGTNVDNDDFKVIIRGQKDMGYGLLEPVLVACAEAGVGQVIYQTAPEVRLVGETR